MNLSSWMLLPTRGARNEHVESLHKTKSAQLGLVRVPLIEKGSPQTEVHSISFAAQLPDISVFAIAHFLGLFLIAFLQRQGFILADKRTKKDRSRRFLATWIR